MTLERAGITHKRKLGANDADIEQARRCVNQQHRKQRPPMASYWPQGSIALGLLLGLIAGALEDAQLGYAATNFVTIGSAFALQRRRNERRSDD